MLGQKSAAQLPSLGSCATTNQEHLRWYLELKDGLLIGKVWAVHDSPKKWVVDWTGPLDLVKADR